MKTKEVSAAKKTSMSCVKRVYESIYNKLLSGSLGSKKRMLVQTRKSLRLAD